MRVRAALASSRSGFAQSATAARRSGCAFQPEHFLHVRDAAVRVGQRHDGRFAAFVISAAKYWIDQAAPDAARATGLTCAGSIGILKSMEVSLLESQEVQLNNLALRTGRGTDELIQEAVARLLAHNEWFKEQVQVGIDQIARGEFIEEEEMDARVKRMLDS